MGNVWRHSLVPVCAGVPPSCIVSVLFVLGRAYLRARGRSRGQPFVGLIRGDLPADPFASQCFYAAADFTKSVVLLVTQGITRRIKPEGFLEGRHLSRSTDEEKIERAGKEEQPAPDRFLTKTRLIQDRMAYSAIF